MGENTLQISTPKLLKHWEKFVSSCEGFFFFEPARRVSPGSCSLSLSFSYTVCLKNGEIPSKVFPTFHNNFYVYRVSHNEMSESQCFWGVEGSIILLIFLWRHVQDNAHLSFINQFFYKWHSLSSTASGLKDAKIELWIPWFYPKNLCFQNIKIRLF